MFILTFWALALAWNVVIPPFENLDEIEHFEVVRHIAVTGRLPIHGEAEAAGFGVRQEASQPPLYHILGAAWLRLLNLPTVPPDSQGMPSAVVACGPSSTFYNKTTRVHSPYKQKFPWHGPLLTLHMLRLFSTLLQTTTVLGTWTLARRLFPKGPVPLLTTAVVTFNPQFLLVATGVNNDNLVTPLATWALVLALELAGVRPSEVYPQETTISPKKLLAFGALAGLAGLSKLSGLALLGLGGLVLLARAWKAHVPLRRLILWGLLMGLPALLIVAPWMIRNFHLYGDPTALTPMLEKVGRQTDRLVLWTTVELMTLSYWGQMPCTFYPRALYWPYILFSAGGSLGLLGALVTKCWHSASTYTGTAHTQGPRFTPSQKIGFSIAALWFGIITAAWVRWQSLTAATGGRLLFPASAALALLMAAGWDVVAKWARQRHSQSAKGQPGQSAKGKPGQSAKGKPGQSAKGKPGQARGIRILGAFFPIWALVTLLAGPVLIFTPPPLISKVPRGSRANGRMQDGQVQNLPLQFTFGDAIVLADYEAYLTRSPLRCWLAAKSYCSPALHIRLDWQAKKAIAQNWTMALQLVSAAPGDTTLRLNYNAWPGRGTLPTSAWPASPTIRDSYVLPLGDYNRATQAWTLQAIFFDIESGERLPVTVQEQPRGTIAPLITLRIPDQQPTCPNSHALTQPVRLDNAVELTHAEVSTTIVEGDAHPQGETVWKVTLCWQSIAPLTEDYTVFVHAYATDGTLLATGDGPPMNNAFPTSFWVPGDRVVDSHTLVFPLPLSLAAPSHVPPNPQPDSVLACSTSEGAGIPAQIGVGFYHPQSGERLPAMQGETRLPNDVIIIWESPP